MFSLRPRRLRGIYTRCLKVGEQAHREGIGDKRDQSGANIGNNYGGYLCLQHPGSRTVSSITRKYLIARP